MSLSCRLYQMMFIKHFIILKVGGIQNVLMYFTFKGFCTNILSFCINVLHKYYLSHFLADSWRSMRVSSQCCQCIVQDVIVPSDFFVTSCPPPLPCRRDFVSQFMLGCAVAACVSAVVHSDNRLISLFEPHGNWSDLWQAALSRCILTGSLNRLQVEIKLVFLKSMCNSTYLGYCTLFIISKTYCKILFCISGGCLTPSSYLHSYNRESNYGVLPSRTNPSKI